MMIWSDKDKADIAKLWAEGKLTQSQIAEMYGVSSSVMSGLFNRDRDMYPKRGYRARSVKGKITDAEKRTPTPKRVKASPPSRPGLIQGQGDYLSPEWRVEKPTSNVVIFYFKNELTARFRFERKHPNSNWKGHGVYAMSLALINKWVNSQVANGEIAIIPVVETPTPSDIRVLTNKGEPLHSRFRSSMVKTGIGKRMFVYLGLEHTPRFTFNYRNNLWQGHGVGAKNANQIFLWINTQKLK